MSALTANDRSEPESLLRKFITCFSGERESLLESSTDLEIIYQEAALRGNTSPPPAQDEVDLHYICFIKSSIRSTRWTAMQMGQSREI